MLNFQSSESHRADYYVPEGNSGALTGNGPGSVMSDDGGNTKRDRKAMKRIQNRIAQRTYRSRMRQRLEDLQRQVDSQEREGLRRQNKSRASGNSGSMAVPSPIHDSNTNDTNDSMDHSSIDAPNTPENNFEVSHLHLRGTNADSSPAKPIQVPAHPPQPPSEKHFVQPLQVDRDGLSQPQFANIALPNSPHFPSNPLQQPKRGPAPGSEQMPYPYVCPSYACQDLRMQAELMQDCFVPDCSMHYHTGSVSRIVEFDPSVSYRDFSNQKVLTVDTENSHPGRVPDLKGMSESTFQDPTSVTFKMPPTIDDLWKQAVQAERLSDPASPKPDSEESAVGYPDSLNSKVEKQSNRESSTRGRSDSLLGTEKSHQLGKDATLDDRFEYILESAKEAGFNDFDSLVANYYTADFSDCSILSNEQRLSRNRRLPGILAKLREKSEGWTQWERQGYQDEILKSAETIFVAECKTFSQNRNFQDGLFEDDGGENEGGTRSSSSPAGNGSSLSSQATPAIKRTFQNELPNLWTLVTALTTDNTALHRRHRSQTSFAAMLVLCCSGRISATQLGVYLREYLENQERRQD